MSHYRAGKIGSVTLPQIDRPKTGQSFFFTLKSINFYISIIGPGKNLEIVNILDIDAKMLLCANLMIIKQNLFL